MELNELLQDKENLEKSMTDLLNKFLQKYPKFLPCVNVDVNTFEDHSGIKYSNGTVKVNIQL